MRATATPRHGTCRAANNIPQNFATEGTWYDFFSAKFSTKFPSRRRPQRHNVGEGFAIFQYPNEDRASTKWYHDHTQMTRLNVYAGPAGFYLLAAALRETRRCWTAGMAAWRCSRARRRRKGKFPSNKTYYEIPIAIQDRSFNADGSLFYPDSREFFDGIVRDYIPHGEFSPIWNPEFFGNTIMANGNTWPFQTVEQRRYRFRFLNGCQSRFLILDFQQIPGVEVWAIGNEGGSSPHRST